MVRDQTSRERGALISPKFGDYGGKIEMSPGFLLTPRHVRAARGLLNMSQEELAGASGLNARTIRDFENGKHLLRDKNLEAIRDAFERRGVEFTNGSNPGVRFVTDKAVIPLS